MIPTIERAIVVTIDEAATLLMALDDERKILQDLSNSNPGVGNFFIDRFRDIGSLHRKLMEVQRLMVSEECSWKERLREYEDSGHEESSTTEEDDE